MMFMWRWDIAWPETLLKAPLASYRTGHSVRGPRCIKRSQHPRLLGDFEHLCGGRLGL